MSTYKFTKAQLEEFFRLAFNSGKSTAVERVKQYGQMAGHDNATEISDTHLELIEEEELSDVDLRQGITDTLTDPDFKGVKQKEK